MDLCQDCFEFAIAISKRQYDWSRSHGFWNDAGLRSGFCRLCKMISEYVIDNADENISTLDDHVKLYYSSFEANLGRRPLSSVRLDTILGVRIDFNVWSDSGSPAALSGAVSYRPPLPSDNCPAAFAHINYWIQDCIQNHEQCKYTVSNSRVDEIQGPKLPRRVLDLGCANDTDLSLVETHDERGNYCALSYCWGPPGWNHLLTTRANIESHFDGIKFDQLPRTLQDAVIVTRRIGIRYLWIDSLCIIQGDTADWTLESAKMAEVYQNAYLVIAASGAKHPGEGCFSNRRRCPTAVEVPYLSETGQAMGSILLSMCLPEEQYPALGPLWERGWALQERRLARRMLHFMPRGMSWKCTELESGERYPYDMSQYPGWDSILQEFSECQLTYEKDRLVAIEGLGRAVQEADGDRYTFGILESQLPELLLWTLSSDELDTSEDLVSAPTWCWASKGGSKIFWGTQYILGKSLIKKSGLTIEGSGALRIEGVLQECRVSSNESDGLELPFLHGRLSDLLEDTKPLYLFEITSATFDFRGIAAFDREYSEKVYVLVLNKLKYGSGDGLEKFAFAAVLLAPNAEKTNSFRRIGMGFGSSSSDFGDLSSAFRVVSII